MSINFFANFSWKFPPNSISESLCIQTLKNASHFAYICSTQNPWSSPAYKLCLGKEIFLAMPLVNVCHTSVTSPQIDKYFLHLFTTSLNDMFTVTWWLYHLLVWLYYNDHTFDSLVRCRLSWYTLIQHSQQWNLI